MVYHKDAKVLPDQPTRLVDYVTLKLGLRESKDLGLQAWLKDDLAGAVATSEPKAKKAVKKANGEAQVQA